MVAGKRMLWDTTEMKRIGLSENSHCDDILRSDKLLPEMGKEANVRALKATWTLKKKQILH